MAQPLALRRERGWGGGGGCSFLSTNHFQITEAFQEASLHKYKNTFNIVLSKDKTFQPRKVPRTQCKSTLAIKYI